MHQDKQQLQVQMSKKYNSELISKFKLTNDCFPSQERVNRMLLSRITI